MASINPEKINTHTLCWLNTIKKGREEVIAATVAPMPRVTKIIGSAQQINVPLVANKVNQLKLWLVIFFT